MRQIVRDYIASAVDHAKPDLERFIAGHLECPEAVPLLFTNPVASIREIRDVKVRPRFAGDYPLVDVVATVRVAMTARTQQRGVDLGTRTIAMDVAVDAVGNVVGHGYEVVPQRARLVAWWGG